MGLGSLSSSDEDECYDAGSLSSDEESDDDEPIRLDEACCSSEPSTSSGSNGREAGRFRAVRTGEDFRSFPRCPQNCFKSVTETEFGKFEVQYKKLPRSGQQTFALLNYDHYLRIEAGGSWWRDKFMFNEHEICKACYLLLYNFTPVSFKKIQEKKAEGEKGTF